MALKQHKDHYLRYEQQVDNSRNYVLPFIEKSKPLSAGMQVLEIGTGEGGVLKPFIDKGCYCVGVDLDSFRIDLANDLLKEEVDKGKAKFLYKNVFDEDFKNEYLQFFDLIILKDTIEHIPDQENFIPFLKHFLKSEGQIFFGFPPWQMPFGGHQQLAEGKWTSKLPWYHLLPMGLYRQMLKMAGETERTIITLEEIKDTGISIGRFEKIVKESGFTIKGKTHFLINPIYKFKFGLQPRKQFGLISSIPFFRDFVTTCVYYMVG